MHFKVVKKKIIIREESDSTEKPRWSARVAYERSHSRPWVATGLAHGSWKNEDGAWFGDRRAQTGKPKKFFSKHFFFWNPLLVFVVGCGMAESASFFFSALLLWNFLIFSPKRKLEFCTNSAWRNPPVTFYLYTIRSLFASRTHIIFPCLESICHSECQK